MSRFEFGPHLHAGITASHIPECWHGLYVPLLALELDVAQKSGRRSSSGQGKDPPTSRTRHPEMRVTLSLGLGDGLGSPVGIDFHGGDHCHAWGEWANKIQPA